MNETGYLEGFSLADDRNSALDQLIQGTEDYYYYHCLHFLNTGNFTQVTDMLEQWIKEYGKTERAERIECRKALLEYPVKSEDTVSFIKNSNGIYFDHEKDVQDIPSHLSEKLDQALIGRESFEKNSQNCHGSSDYIAGYEDSLVPDLIKEERDMDILRRLLSRLQRPDVENLSRYIIKELNNQYTSGFGSFDIHRKLTLDQLEECIKAKNDLINEPAFVAAYLSCLRPDSDVDIRFDLKENDRYLERVWAFVSRLGPVHISLKAQVLFHRLDNGRRSGNYDRDLFMLYLKIPKNTSYVNREYLDRDKHDGYIADLNSSIDGAPCTPVTDDEPLVRDYFDHFFAEEKDYKKYIKYVNEDYLKERFAEAKLVNGIGDMKKWNAMLSPEKMESLRKRVDLDFSPANKNVFMPEEQVELGLKIKNVEKLIIKVYEINTLNYFLEEKKNITTDIDLDGLVANEERVETYEENPLRSIFRKFLFSSLDNRRGVFVIEFIGNGRSSRALIRKGVLRFHEQLTTAGHVFMIYDEHNRKVDNAVLRIGSHEYSAEENGSIVVPYSTDPGEEFIVISHNGFSSLGKFNHRSENYRLEAGIFTDREGLIRHKKAKVIIRPSLFVNGAPATLKVLENINLDIRSDDHDGISSTDTVFDLELFDDRESIHEFQVPDSLSTLTFCLKAKVKNVSCNRKDELSVTETFQINSIDKSFNKEDMHVACIHDVYMLDVLGKTGEPKADRAVCCSFKHKDFTDTIQISLKTDREGRIILGALKDIQTVSADGPEGVSRSWGLIPHYNCLPGTVHAEEGDVIRIPYPGNKSKAVTSEISLFELRGASYFKDNFDLLSVEKGYMLIKGLAPGDHELYYKPFRHTVRIRVCGKSLGQEPVLSEGYVMNPVRHLELPASPGLQIVSVETGKGKTSIHLNNTTGKTRVHAVAVRYLPVFQIFDLLSLPSGDPKIQKVSSARSLYLSGRDIGDEYRYILERKYAEKYPGNMLTRPELLLNPWALGDTRTEIQKESEGEEWDKKGDEVLESPVQPAPEKDMGSVSGLCAESNIGFLKNGSVVLENLKPDNNGIVAIDNADIHGKAQLYIIATDTDDIVCRNICIYGDEALRPAVSDLTLRNGLDPEKHFSRRSMISFKHKEEALIVRDISSSEFEIYDTLDKVYGYYMTMTSNSDLEKFAFAMKWPEMEYRKKCEKYSEFACHELNFFLYNKDRPFFDKAVLPYLHNKKDPTFLDIWFMCEDGTQDIKELLYGFLEPWRFMQLNILEKILLSRRIDGGDEWIREYIKDLFDLVPFDPEQFSILFDTAVKGGALEVGGDFGAGKAAAEFMEAAEEPLDEEMEAEMIEDDAISDRAKSAAPKPMRKMKKEAQSMPDSGMRMSAAKPQAPPAGSAGRMLDVDSELAVRDEQRRLYSALEKTKEYAENNYYHVRIDDQDETLIGIKQFWNDYAAHDEKEPFYSGGFTGVVDNFSEMMMALAVLDLPFSSGKHEVSFDGATMEFMPGSPLVVCHREINEMEPAEAKEPVLVSQNFFRMDDRYRYEDNMQFDKYITEEFLVNVVYGCQVVVTNPTSSLQKLDLLVQIPQKAVPVMNGKYTNSMHVELSGYMTHTYEFYFYFPFSGKFKHYPVHVSSKEVPVAFAEPFTFNVVEKPTIIDKTTWEYISQNGSEAEVLSYLQNNNLNRIDLERIAWRVKDKDFYEKVVDILHEHHIYSHVIWSYSLMHGDLGTMREFLQNCNNLIEKAGPYITCKLLTIDPVVRKTYQHLEYKPLVNARFHRLGDKRVILNDKLYGQYMKLMDILAHKDTFDDDDLMALTYYLMLQERVLEAEKFFKRVNPENIETKLQYDYFRLYFAYKDGDIDTVEKITGTYLDYPVERWRRLFARAGSQLKELKGKKGADENIIDDKDRTEIQTHLADTEPVFDFKIDNNTVNVNYKNISQIKVNYYLMDIELLFSRKPFVEKVSGQFSYIMPISTDILDLPEEAGTFTFDLPEKYRSSNVMVEIESAGIKRSDTYYSNSMNIQIINNYGLLKVLDEETGKPIPGVYVKVYYCAAADGEAAFYKDGYTDPRGYFDYSSLSTDELDNVEKFSILIISEEYGAIVKETTPPKR